MFLTRAALAERDCGSVMAALCQGNNLMCQKYFGISGILNCVRKICGLAGVTYYQKIWVVCGACCCASMASLICADDCSAAVAAFACITPISSIVNAINLAFVLFVIAKIIGLVVLCFRYQYAKILLLHRVPVSSFLLICCRILRFCNPPMRNIVYKWVIGLIYIVEY